MLSRLPDLQLFHCTHTACMCQNCPVAYITSPRYEPPSGLDYSNWGYFSNIVYVREIFSSTTFSVSLTRGGAPLNFGSGGINALASCIPALIHVVGIGKMSFRLVEVKISGCSSSALQLSVSRLDTSAFFQARFSKLFIMNNAIYAFLCDKADWASV
jgi:hypothetical protein